MAEKTEQLFVYGTLKPGYRNHAAIKRFVRSVQPGWIEGRLGMWRHAPGLVAGHGRVIGVVLEIEPEALVITDRIEDYRPGAADSLYVRRRVDVYVEMGLAVSAWTYFFGDATQLTDYSECHAGEGARAPRYEWPSGECYTPRPS